jgi:hypothetical protein
VLRHPSKRYIYYLFSRRTMDVATIVQHLGDLQLPVPQKKDTFDQFVLNLLAERKRMRFPAGFNPAAPTLNPQTEAFLDRWKIRGMWAQDTFVGKAADLLFEPAMRRMVETLCLGPLAVPDIAKRVRDRFGLDQRAMNTRVVREFMHYYWDDTALSPEEWRSFVFGWIPGYNNDYLTALGAPRSAAGAALTVSTADRGGGASLNPVIMYAAIRDQGFRMFMEHVLHDKPGLTRTQGAMFALQIVTSAEEELDKRRGGSAELIEELHKIETIYDEKKLTSVHDLPQIRKALPSQTVIDAEHEVVEEKKKEPTS